MFVSRATLSKHEYELSTLRGKLLIFLQSKLALGPNKNRALDDYAQLATPPTQSQQVGSRKNSGRRADYEREYCHCTMRFEQTILRCRM